jgi:hypothetical protein
MPRTLPTAPPGISDMPRTAVASTRGHIGQAPNRCRQHPRAYRTGSEPLPPAPAGISDTRFTPPAGISHQPRRVLRLAPRISRLASRASHLAPVQVTPTTSWTPRRVEMRIVDWRAAAQHHDHSQRCVVGLEYRTLKEAENVLCLPRLWRTLLAHSSELHVTGS